MPHYNFKYSYDEFPKWQDEAEGMEIIRASDDYIRVNINPDIVYAVKDGIKLRLRMAVPERTDARPFPLIMHVKGSGWDVQNISGNLGDFAQLVSQGYGVAIIQYRHSGQAKYPAQVEDLKSAARYIASHHEELNIDLSNLFLSGDSSGGHTAVMGYLTWNTQQLDDSSETAPLPPLRGLIDYYGVTSIRDLCSRETGLSKEDNALLADLVFDRSKPFEQQFALSDYSTFIDLRKDLEPVLIMHGNKDRLVPLSHSVDLYKDLKKRNVSCSLVMIDGSDHGHTLFWNPQTIDRILKFLRENTK